MKVNVNYISILFSCYCDKANKCEIKVTCFICDKKIFRQT